MEMLESEIRTDIFDVEEPFADELERMVVRCFHGCRTEDAGHYLIHGIRAHRRDELEARLRAMIAEDERLRWMAPTLSERMAEFPSATDEHRSYVVLDDRFMLEHAAHYLIYGSEWIAAVLGRSWRHPLLERGVPTMIEVDLPLSWVTLGMRKALSRLLLSEWTRQTVDKPAHVYQRSFTFILDRDLPPEIVAGHYHPETMKDPWDGRAVYRSPRTVCEHCGNNDGRG
ncbi:MAG: hypothetical protein H7Z12_15275 [Rhodospirillaceae bacterium]|nr:hypothetical protein [Rhodospirillales bacterium]